MPAKFEQREARRRTILLWLFLAAVATSQTGCQWFRSQRNTFASLPWRQEPCVFPPDVTTSQLIAHLNANTSRLHGWRSTNARIRASGLPVNLSATVAVESPKNFRMTVKSFTQEADLGSNSERFWFWMQRNNPKHVFTARHDEIEQLRGRVALPFEPTWLMEALGVVPIDESTITGEQPLPDQRQVRLVSERVAPDGRQVRKVIVVDTCRGHIAAHELYDANNQLIAKATLDDYFVDPASGVRVPRRIHLDWPPTQMAMTLELGRVEVNPHNPPEVWQMPHYPNTSPYDLAGNVRTRQRELEAGLASAAEPAGTNRPIARPVFSQTADTRVTNASGTKEPSPFDSPSESSEIPPPNFDSEPAGDNWYDP